MQWVAEFLRCGSTSGEMYRIYIDGLPGTNKRALAAEVARALDIPLYAANIDDELESRSTSDDPDVLALWLLWVRSKFSVDGPGVFVGSPESWNARVRLRFEHDSVHPSARQLRDVLSALTVSPSPSHRVLICATPEEAMATAPAENYAGLVELKTAENNLPDPTLIYNICDPSIASAIVAHVTRPPVPIAKYM